MAKVLFTPFSVIGSLIAGFAARKAFDRVWALIDDTDEPPEPGHQDIGLPKIMTAVILQAAVFAGVRALFDRGARKAFLNLFGTWPGGEAPDERPG